MGILMKQVGANTEQGDEEDCVGHRWPTGLVTCPNLAIPKVLTRD